MTNFLVFSSIIIALLETSGDCTTIQSFHNFLYPGKFSYDSESDIGPSYWHTLSNSKSCKYGKTQSPIDINTDRIDHISDSDEVITMEYEELEQEIKGEATNNEGHTLVFNRTNQDIPCKLIVNNGKPSNATYILDKIHFHIGRDLDENYGTEHSIDGKFFAMEKHAVHYKEEHGSLEKALGEPDGVIVIGTFYENSDSDSYCSAADKFIRQYAPDVEKINSNVPAIVDSDLLSIPERWVSYEGSETTPPCTEQIRWIVDMDEDKKCISQSALEKLGELQALEGEDQTLRTFGNTRPIQKIEKVTIKANFDGRK